MNKYPLDKLCELVRFDCGDNGYIGVADMALCLLKRPDSLLCQVIQRSKRNPEHFRELLLGFRPKSRQLSGEKMRFTGHLESLIRQWQKDGVNQEEDITIALLEGANALTYVACILNVPSSILMENVKEGTIEGPIRINTPALNKGVNLSAKARRGELPACIGRESEIRRIASILQRMKKNMPVLIGEAGVGKTAVVEGFAQYLLSDEAPVSLRNCTVIEFPVSLFSAGHKYVGEVEQFTLRVIEELKRNPDVILFLDEIHQVIGAGRAENQTADVAQILKPALSRAEIKVIGATTLDEYMILEKDAAFERRINPVKIEEPSVDEAVKMLQGSKKSFENHYQLNLPDDTLEIAVKLSHDYLTHRKLPDKAFDLLDSSCSRVKTFTSASRVTPKDIVDTLVEMTGIETADIDTLQKDKLARIESNLLSEVIGQDTAVRKVINKLKIGYSGLMRREKPLGVFLFMGMPGGGKTHLARSIAKHLFGDSKHFLRLDMGEFTEEVSVSRLIGSSPGYVGYEEGGILTEFVKNNPFSVLLFDEIEKAHYRIADVFLALFGEGRVTDSRGRTMDARNTVCIMTSNQGVEELAHSRHTFLGEIDEDELERRLRDELEKAFRPEFLNRIDEVVIFRNLELEDLDQIAKLHLAKIQAQLANLGIHISFDKQVTEVLAEETLGMGTGARHLERLIEDKVLLPLSEMRLNGEFEGIKHIIVKVIESRFDFQTEV